MSILIQEAAVPFYNESAEALLKHHIVHDGDENDRTAEDLDKGAIDPISYQGKLHFIVDNYLGNPGEIGTQLSLFLETLPQTERIEKSPMNKEFLAAIHALQILQQTRSYLVAVVEETDGIEQSASQHDNRLGGDADLSNADDDSDPVIDDKGIAKAAREGDVTDAYIGRTANEDMASESEIGDSAQGGNGDEYSKLTPGLCFLRARRKLFSGIIQSCRDRISPMLPDLERLDVVTKGDVRMINSEITISSLCLKFDLGDERQDIQ